MVKLPLTPEHEARRTWLERLLDWHGLKFKRLNYKIMTAGDPVHATPDMANRLNRWLEQIGLLKRREAEIVSEIEAIERQHRLQRQHSLVKQADPETKTPDPLLANPVSEPKRGEGLAWLAWLWAMVRRGEYNKKQRLSGN